MERKVMSTKFQKTILCLSLEVRKEVSLAIIKPDAVKAGLVDDIIQKVSCS